MEALESRCLMASDFGDAPDTGAGIGIANYETLLASGGPSHVIDTTQSTLFLGQRVDSEVDGLPNSKANGDDLILSPAADDEDGVIDPNLDLQVTAGSIPQVRVRATNTTGSAATLYGWIDVNRDGLFDNTGERASIAVPTGTNNGIFTLNFPSIAVNVSGGKTYARFRLSTDAAAANPNGPATDGEVEDYQATVTRISSGQFDPVKSTRIADSLLGGPVLQNTDKFGSATANLGDLDGTGKTFVAVGAPGRDAGGTDSGAVYLMPINANGSAGTSILLTSGIGGVPTYLAGDRFGAALANIGDINGDGIPDLAVGAPGDDTGGTDRGAIYLLRMNANGSVAGFSKYAGGTLNLPAITNGDAFGTSIASIPDLDGDGIGELAVGSSLSDLGGLDRGSISILLMNGNGSIKNSLVIGGGIGGGPALVNGDRFGASIASIGDLNNDGLSDIAVGAIGDDTGWTDAGACYVLFLSPSGAAGGASKISLENLSGLVALGPWNYFGSSVGSVGDTDGDGHNDLSVGATGYFSSGAMYNLLMNPNGSVKAVRSLNDFGNSDFSLNFGDDFAASLAPIGDLDGDGIPELVAGTPGDDNNGTDRGGIRVVNLRADNVAPVMTVRRQTPIDFDTNADTLKFAVTFDEDVFNFDPTDLIVSGTTAIVQSVTQIQPLTYEVLVGGGNLASLNGFVSLAVAGGRDVADRVGNLLPAPTPNVNESYRVDNTAPTTVSITRLVPSVHITSKDSVQFRVAFSESVTNVDTSDFVATGTTASMTLTGFGAMYEVTLSGGDLANLSGTVGLNLSPSQNISDLATNPVPSIEPSIDETFTMVQSTLDFGDAPDTGIGTGIGNYQTSLADNGPRHTIVAGLRLGVAIDEEPDGLTADDGPNISPAQDDEDGFFDNPLVWTITTGSTPRARLRATNTTANPATLYGWIDLNRNGIFDNASERTSVVVPAGTNNGVFTLSFPLVSPGFAPGSTQVRFRLSTDPAASSSTGLAADGEVEDYAARLVRVGDGTIDSAKSREIESGSGNGFFLSTSDNYGSAVAPIGDINNDGIVDMIVGARLGDYSSGDEGEFFVHGINSNGTANSTTSLYYSPFATSDFAGTSLAPLGDFNGDGLGDFVAGAPGNNTGGTDRGSVLVTYLASDGYSAYSLRIGSGLNGGPALANNDFFGTSVSSLGDFDGDGVTDIAVGAVGDDTGGLDRGAVYILLLNSNRTVKSSLKIANGLNGGPTLANSDRFGSSIANLGDIDADGVTDIAVGASLDDTTGTDRGAIYVLRLNANGSVKASTKIAGGLNGGPTLVNGDQFGYASTGMGDFYGDGSPDLMVGAPYDNTGATDAGAIYLMNLRSDGTVRSFTKVARSTNGGPSTLASGDRFGTSVAVMGDIDSDGMIDLAVGAEGNDGAGYTDSGAIHMVFLRRDLNAPTAVAFARQSPVATATNADSLIFRASFNEDVLNVSNDDFAVTGSTATVTNVTSVSAGQIYDVTVSGGDLANFNGLVGLDISVNSNIVDRANNLMVFSEPAIDHTYLLDNSPPQLSSIVRLLPSTNPTSADVLRFRATFNEAVTGVEAADFAVGGATASIVVAQISTTVYELTLSAGNLAYVNGNVGINVAAGVSIVDDVGNALPTTEPSIDETFTLVFHGTDFGDAPDGAVGTGPANYRTNLNDNGPRHTMTPGLSLGSLIDDEADGQASDDALLFVLDNDDEDGLVDPSELNVIEGQSPTVRLRATNLGLAQAVLHGWIDTNRDGLFDNATEKASVVVPAGSNNQTFSLSFGQIPYSVTSGATFARFRLSTDPTAGDSFGSAGDGEVEDYSATVIAAPASVMDRRVFYNRATSTVFGDGSGNPINSIAPDKTALLPGQTTSAAHYTNYARGLNGLIVDLVNPSGSIGVGDFQFATWNGIDLDGFTASSATATVSTIVDGGLSGSTRVKIEFDDAAIQNTWLRVTVLANANTGLSSNDVFYFGNAVGEMNVGNLAGPPITLRTNASDTATVRQNQSPNQNSVGIESQHDINKDGRVNASDTALVRQNQSPTGSLRFFTAPSNVVPADESSMSSWSSVDDLDPDLRRKRQMTDRVFADLETGWL